METRALGIRTKLSLGLCGLLAILMVVGIQSVILLNELGGSIDLILRENYRSVIACQDIKESLERIDSGLLYTLLGHQQDGRSLIDENVLLFEKALQVELSNITLSGEGQKAAHVQQLFNDYRRMVEATTDDTSSLEVRREVYFNKCLILFSDIKATADAILQMNQENIIKSSHYASEKARESRQIMIALIVIGVLLAAGFMVLISKWILRPISLLTNAANEIKSGNLDIVINTESSDEIGKLAETLDGMAVALREFRRTDRAQLFRIMRSTEQAFNILPDAIAIIDNTGNIELVNKAASDFFGLKVGQKLSENPFPGLTQLYNEALNTDRIIESMDKTTLMQRFVRGEERFFRPRSIPILSPGQYPTGIILLLSDATQEHQQNELKKGVVATAAHQLRTPLTSVRMALHLLLEEKVGPLTEKQMDLALAAREESDRLYTIIERLLSMSRMESGKAKLDLKAVSAQELVFESVEPFQKKAIDLGVTISINLPIDLPAVYVDSLLVSQVFANLLSNSLKYTDRGGSIIVSAEYDEEFVIFSVTDTGNGIPEKYLQKILEQFFRVPGQKGETGVGLGLSIVQEIIVAHGGIVRVDSIEGQGSKFTVSVKRADWFSKKE